MKRLILVRHGDYVDGSLTVFGRQQMQELACALAHSVVGNMLLVSSTIQRAKESAAILAEFFQVPVMEHGVWAAPGDTSNNDGALQFIGSIDTNIDTLMVVTHLPFLQSFPAFFGKEALNVSFSSSWVEKGQAQVIDCMMKTMTLVKSGSKENGNEPLSVQSAEPTSRANGNYTREHAKRYAVRLKQVAPKNRLRKIYLFGSIAKYGRGNDVDLVLEVSPKVFLEFASACVGALNGFHPVTGELLPLASAYWCYESPKEARSRNALEAIAVLPWFDHELAHIVPHEKIDVLCLPTGWREKTDVNKVLHTAFGFGKDPNLLQHIVGSVIELA